MFRCLCLFEITGTTLHACEGDRYTSIFEVFKVESTESPKVQNLDCDYESQPLVIESPGEFH